MPDLPIDDENRRRRLAMRHRLVPAERTDDVEAIVDDLVAVHSSDPATVFVSLAARMQNPSVAAIEHALYEDRAIVRHHAMRRTLWVMSPPFTAAADAACTRKIAAVERKRAVAMLAGDERWLDEAIVAALRVLMASDQPLSTRQIREVLPEFDRSVALAPGTKHESVASGLSRAILVAAFERSVMRTRPSGSWISSQYGWIDPDRWTPVAWGDHDQTSGARFIVGRWLERFGPGTLADIVWWTGMTKTSVRRALAELPVQPVSLTTGDGFVLANDLAEPIDPGPWVALLPALDSTAMGWKQRDWYLDERLATSVVDRNGNIGPTVWSDGRIVGGWAQRADGAIALDVPAKLPPANRRLLDVEIDRLTDWLGDDRFRVRFPPPNQTALLA